MLSQPQSVPFNAREPSTMFPAWRLRFWEARAAYRNGRYDDAAKLVLAASVRDFLPIKRLAADVAAKMVERAGQRFEGSDSLAGWQDLAIAERLGGQTDAIHQTRRRYVEQAVNEVQRYLAAGHIGAAQVRLQGLQQRGLCNEHTRILGQLARLMEKAQTRASRGHFQPAVAAMEQAAAIARTLVPVTDTMKEIVDRLSNAASRLAASAGECQRLSAEMHAALAAKNWNAVLSTSEALLTLAPQHTAAAQARRRAWHAVGMDVTQAGATNQLVHPVSLEIHKAPVRGERSTRRSVCSREVDTVTGSEHPRRALLWVDAVGGFLMCMDDGVVLGQPAPGGPIAVPILADLSRRHAIIRRDAGAYVLEPLQRTRVDGREIDGPHVLADQQLIQLGDNVRIRFTRPHALSATARLTIESHHKTQPSADAVLLMADSCVLGPHAHCHVRCRHWQRDVVVYRQNDRWYCQAEVPVSIDGVPAIGPCEIKSGTRVEGEDFSFTWETLE